MQALDYGSRDLWPESISAVGLIDKTSLIYKFLSYVEKNISFSKGCCYDRLILKLFIKQRLENKIFVIKNGYIKDFIKPPEKIIV